MAAFLMFLTVAVGLFCLVEMAKMNAGTEEINNDWLPSTMYALNINVNTSDYRALQVQLASSKTPEDRQRFMERMASLKDEFENNKAKYTPLLSSPQEKQTYESFLLEWQKYKEASTTVPSWPRRETTRKRETFCEATPAYFSKKAAIFLRNLCA